MEAPEQKNRAQRMKLCQVFNHHFDERTHKNTVSYNLLFSNLRLTLITENVMLYSPRHILDDYSALEFSL